MRATWLEACKAYKIQTGKWIVPKRGTPEYAEISEILKIMRESKDPGPDHDREHRARVEESMMMASIAEEYKILVDNSEKAVEQERQRKQAMTLLAAEVQIVKNAMVRRGLHGKLQYTAKNIEADKIISFC